MLDAFAFDYKCRSSNEGTAHFPMCHAMLYECGRSWSLLHQPWKLLQCVPTFVRKFPCQLAENWLALPYLEHRINLHLPTFTRNFILSHTLPNSFAIPLTFIQMDCARKSALFHTELQLNYLNNVNSFDKIVTKIPTTELSNKFVVPSQISEFNLCFTN